MDVLTEVITAQGEFTMTTPNTEEQALQVAPAREPEATKMHTAPRKPRVGPSKGKSGKKATSAQKRAVKPKGTKPAKAAEGTRAGSKAAKVLDLLKRPGRCQFERADENHGLAATFRARVPVRNDWGKNGPAAHVHKGRGRRTNLFAQILSSAYSAPLAPLGFVPTALLVLEDPEFRRPVHQGAA
jgi:hypothetical protein